jgi:TRAP-type C4-dicarboxylate transport system permease small subunit
MKRMSAVLCILLTLSIATSPLFGAESDDRSEFVRTGMTIVGAAAGLAAGASIGVGFSLDAIDTPLSNTLLLTIPVAAAGAAAGALAGRWIANVALRHQPSPLFAIIEGAGLGLVSGAFVGGIVFPLNFAIAYPLLEVPEGYWGRFDYPRTLGMAVLAGGFWGGFFGLIGGAVAVPLISLAMGF